MNKRLETIMQLVPQGIGLVDVGTDHGYLPIVLARSGYGGKLIASDLRPGPLKKGKLSAENAELVERIDFRLADGLSGCLPEEIDTIVIAGMGGDTISMILDRAEWCMSERYTLLLQPMTRAEVLRFWLCNNGYTFEQECFVRDNGEIYQIIKARFVDRNTPLCDAELFCGKFENIRRDPLVAEVVRKLKQRFTYEVNGMQRAGRDKSARIRLCSGILHELEEMEEKLT